MYFCKNTQGAALQISGGPAADFDKFSVTGEDGRSVCLSVSPEFATVVSKFNK